MKTEVQKEKAEAELLAQNGFNITIGKRKFTIKPLTFGAIVKANQYATEIKMNIKGSEISSMVQNYQENTDPLMKFIAVAILGQKWKIKLFTNILAKWLKWNLKPSDAMKITIAILQMYDMANFIPSIQLIAETTITTPRKTERIDGKI